VAEESEIDLENPSIKAAIASAVEASVTGLKTKNSELLGKLKDATGKLYQFESQFEGLDLDAVRGLLSKAGQDEETKLLTEGKLDEVFNRRTERLRGDYDKQLKAETERADKAEAFALKFQGKVLGDSVRAAALKAGALPEATDDIILRAKGVFTLNEEGEAVAVDGEGQAIFGKDGKTPLTPQEWAESLRESAPHLWPRASGTGAPGGSGGQAAMKRSEMNPAQKRDYQRKHGQTAYLQLPK
jgi:G3E family GTPase